jgi:hypothetical protein
MQRTVTELLLRQLLNRLRLLVVVCERMEESKKSGEAEQDDDETELASFFNQATSIKTCYRLL